MNTLILIIKLHTPFTSATLSPHALISLTPFPFHALVRLTLSFPPRLITSLDPPPSLLRSACLPWLPDPQTLRYQPTQIHNHHFHLIC